MTVEETKLIYDIMEDELSKGLIKLQTKIAARISSRIPKAEIVVPGRTDVIRLRGGPVTSPGISGNNYAVEYGIKLLEIREKR